MGVNSLPKTVIGQRRGCDLNPGPSAPESSTPTTRQVRDTIFIRLYVTCMTPALIQSLRSDDAHATQHEETSAS